MKIVGNIPSEDPNVHWNFFDIKDRVILDLGCGKFYSPISTAQWFIEKGAKKVLGVDLSDIGYTNKNLDVVIKNIQSTEDIQSLIDVTKPDVLKCDIEGSEIHLEHLPLYENIKQIGIEYHDAKTKASCERFAENWKFPNMEYYTLLGHDINRIGVIHLWR